METQPTSTRSPFPLGLRGWLALWFSLRVDVSPIAYAVSGFSLMVFKYAVEAISIQALAGTFFSPLAFLNPTFSSRSQVLSSGPAWLGWAQFVWTIPFLWIAVTMSVRRAANAGRSPWLGLLVLVPFINYVTMVGLCYAPPRDGWTMAPQPPPPVDGEGPARGLVAILVGFLIAGLMVGVAVYSLESYGASLFIGSPMLIGAASAFVYNRPQPRPWKATFGTASLAILVPCVALIAFALEGAVCIAMILPLAVPIGLLGAAVGKAIADGTRGSSRDAMVPVVLLPLLAGVETLPRPIPLHEVVTSIEIDAPPERVWRHLVTFPDLPEPSEWYFKLGVACPRGAFIEGSGVGAVRHCVFSTGEFVEPITVWEEPARLAFDVASQPAPMRELSPYAGVHPPHLDNYMESKRGEFRLIPLSRGRTRLEGRTWYELKIYPLDYWLLWSDPIVHAIHRRVLRHIARLAEDRA